MSPPADQTRPPIRWSHCLALAAIISAAWFVYAPALRGSFVWDDRADIVENPLLRDVDGLRKIWLQPTLLFDFYPVKYSVQWVQWQLWEGDTYGYHLTSVALHVLGALLFWRLLRQLGLRHAWVGALLFTVHPLAVESVAWIAELKNTLSLPPLLLACSAFVAFEQSGRRADYLRAVAWFILKLLCKTSGAMLPVVLLLFLWWRRGRIGRRELLLTAPFFALSLVFGLVTIWFQRHRGIAHDPVALGGLASRIALIGESFAHYFRTSVWPVNLLPIYPRWSIDPPTAGLFAAWVVGPVALAWMWLRRATWGRHALLGSGWFLLYLVPFVGVTPISYMRFSWVMDHIAYLPLLGLIGLAVAAIDVAATRLPAAWRFAPLGAVLAVALGLAGLARRHAANFASELALWTHTVAHNPDAWMAHNNLAAILDAKGQRAEAKAHYYAAIRLYPGYAEPHKNLADQLREAGDLAAAQPLYERALQLKPDFPEAHVALAELLRTTRRPAEAIPHLQAAIRSDPESADLYNTYGLVFRDLGDLEHAIDSLTLALKCRPDFPEAHVNLGSVLRQAGRTDEAVAHFEAALRLRPRSAEVRYNLGNALQSLERHPAAVLAFEQALRLKPDFAVAHYNLAISLILLGRTAEARPHYDEARRLNPGLAELSF